MSIEDLLDQSASSNPTLTLWLPGQPLTAARLVSWDRASGLLVWRIARKLLAPNALLPAFAAPSPEERALAFELQGRTADAVGLLRTAIRCDDPVLFLEHKRLYREPYNRSPHPGPDFLIPFGKAHTVHHGNHLTIVTYGALVHKSVHAAMEIERRHPGKTVDVIDLRTLNPYDWAAIAESVKRTSRVMIVHEDTLSWGYGSEIAARIASELFSYLDAPVGRVAALDTWVGYHPDLENEILPQADDVVTEAERLLAY